MRDNEIAELRRRFKPEKNNVTHLCGCYVSEQKEIISMFDQSFGLMMQEEAEKYLALFKRTLSGTLGKNLIDISFATQQVLEGEEHKLLTTLKDSGLKDADAVRTFFERVTQSLAFEGNYLILLAHDVYDVPYRGKDGRELDDASSSQFSYLVCSVCPVKQSKPGLSYAADESVFHNRKLDWIVAAPELGFMFPAFDDRCTNLYSALYSTRDTEDGHPDFVEAVFHTELPMPAEVQKQTFRTILSDTLESDCSLEVVQTVHAELCGIIEAHKLDKDADPLVLSKKEVQTVLQTCSLPEARMSAFSVQYDSQFGTETELCPRNLIDAGQFEVRTPDVVIKVAPDRRDLIETRVIGGRKYILICADDGVEVNGVNIHIAD